MKKLGIFLAFIMLALICQNCDNNHVNEFKPIGVDYVGVLGYDANPFDATDSCLYFYSDPEDEYGQGKTYVLIQNNNALISIMDSSGNMADSVYMYSYEFAYDSYREFPNIMVPDTTIFSPWPLAIIHLKNCPETLYWDPDYGYQSYCIGDKIVISTGCSWCSSHPNKVPFQMNIDGKEYNFMMVLKIGD